MNVLLCGNPFLENSNLLSEPCIESVLLGTAKFVRVLNIDIIGAPKVFLDFIDSNEVLNSFSGFASKCLSSL